MKKTAIRFFALCLALTLAAPFLAQSAGASSGEAEPYEGTPLFVAAILDANGELAYVLNAFLVSDPETGGTYLLGSSLIYDLVQRDHTAFLFGDDGFASVAIPAAKENGLSYLNATGLENAPCLALSRDGGTKAAAMYRELTSDGPTDPIQKNYDLSSGWTEGSGGLLTCSGHEPDSVFQIGAPMVSTEDSSVLGSITLNGDTVEMMLIPLKPGQLSTAYSLETLNGGGSESGPSETDSPETDSPETGSSETGPSETGGSETGPSETGGSETGPAETGSSETGPTETGPTETGGSGSSETGSSGSGSIFLWVAVVAAVGVLGYLIYRANTRKKDVGPREGTVPLEPSGPAPLPDEPIGDAVPVGMASGSPAPVSSWQLRCVSGALKGQTFPLGAAARIGRGSRCEISFPEDTPGVSGCHCEVSPEDDHVILRDLNSTYGTYLGGNDRLEAYGSYPLHMGDTFTLSQNGPVFRLETLGSSPEESGPAVRDIAGRVYRANAGGRVTFGRKGDNLVRVSAEEQSVSGSHCVLYREAGKLYLMDLGSTNGTFFSEQERLKPNTPYRIHRGMAFFLSNPRNTYVVTEE